MTHTAISIRGITKRFGEVTANSSVWLDIQAGRIHALVGENGAGKSTLMHILAGLHQPDGGHLELNGKPVSFSSPREAIAAGIGMVHQHFMLVDELSVSENIVLGIEGVRLFGKLSPGRISRRVAECARTYGLEIDPDARVSSLGVGMQQRVELLKLLIRDASVMILDEPTAVLTPSETETLFATLRKLAQTGRTIIIITHKLDEVLSLADTISVMRQGKLTGTIAAKEAGKEELAMMMVGRKVLLRIDNPPPKRTGAPVLEARGLIHHDPRGVQKLCGLTFRVHQGEIYGIAGVEGNGQGELLQLLWGLAPEDSSTSGELLLGQTGILGLSPSAIAARGASYVPEDRLRHAVVKDFSVSLNLIFGRHRERSFHKGAGFDRQRLSENAGRLADRFDIRCNVPDQQPLGSLSGGNQQKVVIARELDRPDVRLLILAQPTRGVDIGAIETIHRNIIRARDEGKAILLVSSELEELSTLSTRIGCLYQGTIRHEFDAAATAAGREDPQRFHHQIGLHIT